MAENNSPRFCDLTGVAMLLVAVLMAAFFVSDCGFRFTVARLSADRWADDDHLNALVIAIKSGQPADGVEALSARVDINARDNGDHTPLMHAVRAGRLDLCRRLIDRGADVNASTHTGLNPLMLAVIYRNESILRLLLSRGAGVDAPTPTGRTALMVACCDGNDELAVILLEAGANVNARSHEGVTPIIDVASAPPATPRTLRLIRRLSDAGAALNAADNDGTTALMEAARSDSGQTVALLRSLGADMRARDRHGRDAIAIARDGRCAEALAALLAQPASRPVR